MSEFVHLNFLEYEHFVPKNEDDRLCICCFAKCTTSVTLSSCKHKDFFDIIPNFKMEHPMAVCLKCHSLLKKISHFKLAVEESLKLFNKQIQTTLHKKAHNLNMSPLEIYSTINSEPIKFEVLNEIANEDAVFETTTEIKIEHEECSDFEFNLPLSEIKDEEIEVKRKRRKCENGTKTEKNLKESLEEEQTEMLQPDQNEDTYEGKVKVVTYSMEDLMAERDKEKNKGSYKKLLFKCEDCIVGFDYELNLKEHMDKRHKSKEDCFVCDICKSVLSTNASFKEHCRRHYKRYECEECGARYITERSALNHYIKEHGGQLNETFTCDECGYSTISNRQFRHHQDKHKGRVRCPMCDNTFVNKTGMKRHMLTIHNHPRDRVYECKLCNKVYAGKSGLLAHEASAHSNQRTFCVPCRSEFRCHATLKHHLQTHSRHVNASSWKFSCHDCGAKFLNKANLQRHIDWLHLKTNAYKCEKCSKAFKGSRNLRRHIEFVHEKKQLPRNKICHHCGRGFTTTSILTAHIRTHTGERPLRCKTCGAHFAHPAALYTHNKLLHSNKKADT